MGRLMGCTVKAIRYSRYGPPEAPELRGKVVITM
jgi:hypothetical protein